jgi:hypothetical protein
MRAVYRGVIDALCARARELAASSEPADALAAWLRMLADVADRRGLAAALYVRFGADPPSPFLHASKEAMAAAAAPLLRRAQEAGAIRLDLTVPELLKLSHAIARASEGPEDTERLLSLLLDGLAAR